MLTLVLPRKPELRRISDDVESDEIIADDVRCAHGATVSQLQEDELFYLRSRGITETEATALLLRGYCQEVIDQLPVQADRWRPLEQVHQELSR